jgi:hypothetical protein
MLVRFVPVEAQPLDVLNAPIRLICYGFGRPTRQHCANAHGAFCEVFDWRRWWCRSFRSHVFEGNSGASVAPSKRARGHLTADAPFGSGSRRFGPTGFAPRALPRGCHDGTEFSGFGRHSTASLGITQTASTHRNLSRIPRKPATCLMNVCRPGTRFKSRWGRAMRGSERCKRVGVFCAGSQDSSCFRGHSVVNREFGDRDVERDESRSVKPGHFQVVPDSETL